MEKPTIWSSGPDRMCRTVCVGDSVSRRAQYGKIRPMGEDRTLRSILSRFIPLA